MSFVWSNPVIYVRTDHTAAVAAGTRVVEGVGKMVVTAVGINSAKGVIYNLLGFTYNSVCNNFLRRNEATDSAA